jgi:hypothetical protein
MTTSIRNNFNSIIALEYGPSPKKLCGTTKRQKLKECKTDIWTVQIDLSNINRVKKRFGSEKAHYGHKNTVNYYD